MITVDNLSISVFLLHFCDYSVMQFMWKLEWSNIAKHSRVKLCFISLTKCVALFKLIYQSRVTKL